MREQFRKFVSGTFFPASPKRLMFLFGFVYCLTIGSYYFMGWVPYQNETLVLRQRQEQAQLTMESMRSLPNILAMERQTDAIRYLVKNLMDNRSLYRMFTVQTTPVGIGQLAENHKLRLNLDNMEQPDETGFSIAAQGNWEDIFDFILNLERGGIRIHQAVIAMDSPALRVTLRFQYAHN